MAVNRSIIHESENVRLVAQELGGDVVFVTFNETGLTWKGDSFWGDAFFEKNGLTAFGFVTPRPNWYPAEEMEAAIARAKSLIGGRRVVTYGHSQGGYGALKFARSLSASVALSFCPQASIDPADGDLADGRYTRYHRAELKNGSLIKAADVAPRSFVFYDPRETQDARNVRTISRLPGVERVFVPFSMHDAIRIIAEGKVAAQLVRTAGTGEDLTAARLRNLVRTARKVSATYRAEKTKALLKRAKLHTRFLDAQLATYPDGPLKNALLSVSAAYNNNFAVADRLISEIKDDDLLKLDLLSMWTICRSARFKNGELRIAPLLKIRYPGDCFIRLHAVNSYVNYGLVEKARNEISCLEAISTASGYYAHFVRFMLHIKDSEAAEKYLKTGFEAGNIPWEEAVKLHFSLAHTYNLTQSRQQAIRVLTELAARCHDRQDDLKTVTDHLKNLNAA